MEIIKNLMLQQDAMINQLKASEQIVRTDYHSVKKISIQLEGSIYIIYVYIL